MPQTTARHRSADAALGYAADPAGSGVAYLSIATGTGRAVVKVPFATSPLAGLAGRDLGYAAVAAAAGYLRGRGFTRIRLRLEDDQLVDELNGRGTVPPPLAIAYVKIRCALHGFAVARVERAEPIETRDLQTRATADVALRAPAAA